MVEGLQVKCSGNQDNDCFEGFGAFASMSTALRPASKARPLALRRIRSCTSRFLSKNADTLLLSGTACRGQAISQSAFFATTPPCVRHAAARYTAPSFAPTPPKNTSASRDSAQPIPDKRNAHAWHHKKTGYGSIQSHLYSLA